MLGVALASTGCSSSGDKANSERFGGSAATGGTIAGGTGGSAASTVGGTLPSGGQMPTGGTASGGSSASGGSPSTGGTVATGGTVGVGGTGGVSTGGVATGGVATGGVATGGSATGGAATGGQAPTGGAAPTGGMEGTGDAGAGGGGTSEPLDCSASMPTSGGTTHCGSYRTGRAGDLSWELWSNSYSGSACITYYDVPAFSAQWNNNGDYLARLGIEWGGKSISQLGEITAEFTYTKTGSGGGYSYIGVYGWATSPCVEYYIIEDSFNGMPFNPWNMQQKGSATIDGEVYKFFAGSSGGTGGSRCGTPFQQYWSVRQKGRQCGVMTITKHFEEWKNVGMNMDDILEAKILVETGGGQGSVEFPIANVKSSQ